MKKLTYLGLIGIASIALTACDTSGGKTWDNYFQIDQSQYKVTFNDLRTAYVYEAEANQKGDVKALVVPVELKNYSADKLPAGREGTKEDIEKAIFGGDSSEDPEMAWESLHTFYYKSSYGQCNITGTVTDWYYIDLTPTEFSKTYGTDSLVAEISDYYRKGEGKDQINLDEYDANNDGFVDLLLMVYSCPTGADNLSDSTFWAYTTQHSNPTAKDESGNPTQEALDNPFFSRYWWASYTFMYEDGYYENGVHKSWTNTQIKNNEAKIDTHTFIHESGHGLGLADYYSYDYDGGAPMGGVDMMDNNVGDHNAYSKALMGWISPYVPTGDAKITLRPFETSGDAIIIPAREANWKEHSYSLLDEYYIIQYDTPEGLAYDDGLDAYAGNYPVYYNVPGVRILHTDSRIGTFRNDNGKKVFGQYVSKPWLNDSSYWSDFAHDNTPSRTVNGFNLLELIKPDGTAFTTGRADNSCLFQTGDILKDREMNTLNPYSDPLNRQNYRLGFEIEIGKMDENGVEIIMRAIEAPAE